MTPHHRVNAFCTAYGLRLPILMAPMAGASPPALAVAVARAGGMGACGALSMDAAQIHAWAEHVRTQTNGAFQINTWIPDPAPVRDRAQEAQLRAFLGQWGPDVPPEAGDAPLADFEAQCAAMLTAGPSVISSIMGLYPAAFVTAMKERGIRWFATVTTVAEARAAEDAGADAVIAQGAEAGGHRGSFDAENAEAGMVGSFALIPAVADAVSLPVIATGGIADGRGVAAALVLGASAVQIGTALLRTPEAAIPASWAEAIGRTAPEETVPTRAFSGRLARAIRTPYTIAAAAQDSPLPAPYPTQRALTGPLRREAQAANDPARMQMWAGQSAALTRPDDAERMVSALWKSAESFLGQG